MKTSRGAAPRNCGGGQDSEVRAPAEDVRIVCGVRCGVVAAACDRRAGRGENGEGFGGRRQPLQEFAHELTLGLRVATDFAAMTRSSVSCSGGPDFSKREAGQRFAGD